MRHVALLFAALCLLASPAAAVTAPSPSAGPADSGALGGPPALATAAFGEPRTEFAVSVRENRNARWTVTATFPFETAADRAAFETYAARFEDGGASGGPSVTVFENAARVAENATGREMSIRSVNRTAQFVNDTAGVLRLTFTWTNFVGRGADGQLLLADVFRTAENTTWFRTVRSSQRLVIAPPEGYTISDAPFGVRDGRAVIAGPATLDADDFAIRFQVQEQPPWWATDVALVGFVAVSVVILTALAVLLFRRRSADAGGGGGEGTPTALPSDAIGGDTQPADGGRADSRSNGSVPASDGSDATGADGPTDEEIELLSDEERVERLLRMNGGRMRQAAIVQETGWSDAKVSQLLSTMADEERVEKLRLGRENLISLPGETDE